MAACLSILVVHLSLIAPPAPSAEPPEEWLPAKPLDFNPVPTLFPELRAEFRKAEECEKACPKLFGKDAFAIVPADDTGRRLLKAQLHQATQYWREFTSRVNSGSYGPEDMQTALKVLQAIDAAASDLWRNEPKTLDAVLCECVVLAKDMERFTRARVKAGSDRPLTLNAVQAHRLKQELTLWRHRNPTEAAKWKVAAKAPPPADDFDPTAKRDPEALWTAFPEVNAIVLDSKPSPLSVLEMKIVDSDEPARRMVKARAHQLTMATTGVIYTLETGSATWERSMFTGILSQLLDAVAEVDAADPDQRSRRMKTMVAIAKWGEEYGERKVKQGSMERTDHHMLVAGRLSVEARAWNALYTCAVPPAKKPAPPDAPPEWIVEPRRIKEPREWIEWSIPATAFPEQKPPTSPFLRDTWSLAFEPGDDIYRRLLKSRFRQWQLYARFMGIQSDIGAPRFADSINALLLFDGTRPLAEELWAGDMKQLHPRLAEYVVVAKRLEESAYSRRRSGSGTQVDCHMASVHRLAVEYAVWKQLNPKP